MSSLATKTKIRLEMLLYDIIYRIIYLSAEENSMKSILLVIDVQKGFIKTKECNEAAKKISELLDRGLFDCVIATKFVNPIQGKLSL